MNQYLGDTVCYVLDYSRLIAFYAIQLQSFFHSLFRYICLFHQKFLFKLNLGAHVSIFRQNKWSHGPNWPYSHNKRMAHIAHINIMVLGSK